MPEKTTISIVLPVYNGEDFLKRSLTAIQNQTFSQWECLMVNDGSKDGSAAICKDFAEKDPRFVYLEKENGGISSARNLALDHASGTYLMFCDQDDCYAPTAMQEAVEMIRKYPDAMIHWPYIRNQKEFEASINQPQQWQHFTREQLVWQEHWFITVWNRIYDLDVVQKNQVRFDIDLGWKDRLGEDTDFNEKYIRARWGDGNFEFYEGSQPRYFHYRGNETSVTNNMAEPKYVPREAPKSNYCAQLMNEMMDCIGNLDKMSGQKDRRDFVMHYIRCMAFGVKSAVELGESLPENFWKDKRLQLLLNLEKQNRFYSAYYLPFRLHQKKFITKLYNWDESRDIWFWRWYELMYRLFFRGWYK